MELGISSYSYTWSLGIPGFDYHPPMDVYGLVEKTHQHGLSLLQIADNSPLHVLDEKDMERLKELCRNLNVKLEVGSKGLSHENLQKYLEIASSLDSKILRFVIDDASIRYEPPLSEVKEIIKKAVKQLAARGIILAIENHDRFKAKEFATLIEDINSPNVGICLDCANSLGAGEGIFETVSILSPYTVNVHFKDISIQRKSHKMGFDINGVPFGQGIIPLEWVIGKMPTRCQTGILELWMPPENSWGGTFLKEENWVERSLEYLRGKLGSVEEVKSEK